MKRFFFFVINTIVIFFIGLFASGYLEFFNFYKVELNPNFGTDFYELVESGIEQNFIDLGIFFIIPLLIAFLLMIYSLKSKNYLDKKIVFSKKGFISVVLLFVISIPAFFLLGYGSSFQYEKKMESIPEVIASANKNGNLIFPYESYETQGSFDRRINLSTNIQNIDEMLENHKTIEYTKSLGNLRQDCGIYARDFEEFITINANNIESVKKNRRKSSEWTSVTGLKKHMYCSPPKSKKKKSTYKTQCANIAATQGIDYQGCIDRAEGKSRGSWNEDWKQ